MPDLSGEAMRRDLMGPEHGQAHDNVKALSGTGGPTGQGDPALADLSIEELKARLAEQTTYSPDYIEHYGLSSEDPERQALVERSRVVFKDI